jgi:hypothetical protein
MSHEFESGLFSNNEKAWHGLGNVLPNKVYSTQEAILASGLDWTVGKYPLYTRIQSDDGQWHTVEVPDNRVILRESDRTTLGIVSDRYQPLQNSAAFRFFDIFLAEKDCFISSAVSLHNGRKVCIVAQLEDNQREVVKNDIVSTYLILATSHDGSLSTTIKFTNVRVVCNNTLVVALAGNGAQKSVRHTVSQESKLEQIKAQINLYKMNFENEIDIYKELARRPMNIESARNYLETLFADELNAFSKKNERNATLQDVRIAKRSLLNLKTNPDLQLEGVAGTAWAGFNAVTRAIEDRTKDLDNRYDKMWFGNTSALLDKAKKLALV